MSREEPKGMGEVMSDIARRYNELNKTKMSKELTIQDALVITKCGWSTEVEEELVDIAFAKLRKEARRLHLEYQKEKIEKELNQNKDE